MPAQLSYKTDGTIEVKNFTYIDDAGVTQPINDGVGSVDIVDKKTGESIATDLTLTYIGGSNGRYKASVPYNLPFVVKQKYTARVTLHGTVTGLHYYGELDFPVVIDT